MKSEACQWGVASSKIYYRLTSKVSAGQLTSAESPRLESAEKLAQPTNLLLDDRHEESGRR